MVRVLPFPLFTSCREEFFSETQFPAYGLLGNSDALRALKESRIYYALAVLLIPLLRCCSGPSHQHYVSHLCCSLPRRPVLCGRSVVCSSTCICLSQV